MLANLDEVERLPDEDLGDSSDRSRDERVGDGHDRQRESSGGPTSGSRCGKARFEKRRAKDASWKKSHSLTPAAPHSLRARSHPCSPPQRLSARPRKPAEAYAMSDELKTAQVDADLGDMFSGMKKKKKAKKVVAEEEQPVQEPVPAKAIEIVNATAKPTPAPVPAPLEEPAVAPSEDLDFSDLKKKKKKKTVRIASDDEDDSLQPARTVDAFGNEIITESTTVIDATKEANLATADGDDEFADLKKKKRKGGKKSTFDLEAFEKELAEADASAKPSTDDATPAGSDGEDGEGVEGLDEVPEGEDPFTKAGEEEEGTLSRAEAAAEAKAWLKEDRDYTYTEVSPFRCLCRILVLISHVRHDSCSVDSTDSCLPPIRPSPRLDRKSDTPSPLLRCTEKETSDPSLPTSPTSARRCTVRPSTSSCFYSPSWERVEVLMERDDWSSRVRSPTIAALLPLTPCAAQVVSSRSRSRMSFDDISVSPFFVSRA